MLPRPKWPIAIRVFWSQAWRIGLANIAVGVLLFFLGMIFPSMPAKSHTTTAALFLLSFVWWIWAVRESLVDNYNSFELQIKERDERSSKTPTCTQEDANKMRAQARESFNGLAFLKPTKLKLYLWLVMLVGLCADGLIDNKLEEIWFFAKIPALDAAWKHFNQVGDEVFSDEHVLVSACIVTITSFVVLFTIAYLLACVADLLARKYYPKQQ